MNFNGEIVAGSLLVRESRPIAELLLQGLDPKAVRERIARENTLQKRSPASTRRQTNLILARLQGWDERLLHMIVSGSQELVTQALFATAIKHNRFVGDFVGKVVCTTWRTYSPALTRLDWTAFFEECAAIEPAIQNWTETTKTKLRQVVFRILAEAHVIESTRTLRLTPFLLQPELKQLLRNKDEWYVLRCLEALS